MNTNNEPRFQEILEDIQRIIDSKPVLSENDIQLISRLIESLKEQCRGIGMSFPASVMMPMNPESIHQYIKSEMDKLSVRYKRNRCKMSLFQLAHEIMSDSYLNVEASSVKM
jgi:hypothetical protein